MRRPETFAFKSPFFLNFELWGGTRNLPRIVLGGYLGSPRNPWGSPRNLPFISRLAIVLWVGTQKALNAKGMLLFRALVGLVLMKINY